MPVYFQPGRVLGLEDEGGGWQVARVKVLASPAQTVRAFHETDLFGPLQAGDTVILNSTARQLGLGTGGYDFVYWVCDRLPSSSLGPGHLVKLRYAPGQRKVLALEEPGSPWRRQYLAQEERGLERRPVVVISLHSQLAGVVAGIRSAVPAPIVFIQTDAGALPVRFSRLVRKLKAAGLLKWVISTGHAYGGDWETVSPASGLVGAAALGGEILVIGPGPGVAGTATTYGNSVVGQGQLLDLATALGGLPVACLRLSGSDPRERHRPVSHHTLTALKLAARRAWVPVPANAHEVMQRLRDDGEISRHRLVTIDSTPAIRWLESHGIPVDTMGRGLMDDPLAYYGAGAAGLMAAQLWQAHRGHPHN